MSSTDNDEDEARFVELVAAIKLIFSSHKKSVQDRVAEEVLARKYIRRKDADVMDQALKRCLNSMAVIAKDLDPNGGQFPMGRLAGRNLRGRVEELMIDLRAANKALYKVLGR